MFGRIARRYDLVNSVMTGGVDAVWRRRALDRLCVAGDAVVLDLCCGTGALTRDAARKVPRGQVVGIDFTPEMIAIAKRHGGGANIRYVEGDVLALPFADATFDGALMAFSMRNVVDIAACLREIVRVLKPGASFVNLEVGKPPNAIWRQLFYAYFYRAVPLIGAWIGGDAAAYRYLPESLINFPDAERLAELFRRSGFATAGFDRLMGGVAVIHYGSTPAGITRAEPVEAQAVTT